MDAKEKYKEETGEEWDSIGYPTMGYTDWLEFKFNNVGGIQLSYSECRKIIKLLKAEANTKNDVAMPLYGKIVEYIRKIDESMGTLYRN